MLRLKELLVSIVLVMLCVNQANALEQEHYLRFSYQLTAPKHTVMIPQNSVSPTTNNRPIRFNSLLSRNVGMTWGYFLSNSVSTEFSISRLSAHYKNKTKDTIVVGNQTQTYRGANINFSFLPVSLSFLYHPSSTTVWKSYIGVGGYFAAKPRRTTNNPVNYKKPSGFLLQAGTNYQMTDTFDLNFDLKQYWMQSKLSLNNYQNSVITVGNNTYPNYHSGKFRMKINPTVLGIGLNIKI